MHLEIAIAGMGGQGALTAGQLVAVAGMLQGKHVTNTPSYTPEVRGGTSNAFVVVSDRPIGCMMVTEPTTVVFLCDLSIDRIVPTLRPNARVVYNSTLVAEGVRAPGASVLGVPATALAEELGDVRCANMAALGALTTIEPELPLEWLVQAVPVMLSGKRAGLVELNITALRRGALAAGRVK